MSASSVGSEVAAVARTVEAVSLALDVGTAGSSSPGASASAGDRGRSSTAGSSWLGLDTATVGAMLSCGSNKGIGFCQNGNREHQWPGRAPFVVGHALPFQADVCAVACPCWHGDAHLLSTWQGQGACGS